MNVGRSKATTYVLRELTDVELQLISGGCMSICGNPYADHDYYPGNLPVVHLGTVDANKSDPFGWLDAGGSGATHYSDEGDYPNNESGGGDNLPPYLQEMLADIAIIENKGLLSKANALLTNALLSNPTIVSILAEMAVKEWKFTENGVSTATFVASDKQIQFASFGTLNPTADTNTMARSLVTVFHELFHFNGFTTGVSEMTTPDREAYAILNSADMLRAFGYTLDQSGAKRGGTPDSLGYQIAQKFLDGQITWDQAYEQIKKIPGLD